MTPSLPPDETRVAKNTVIFRQGDPGKQMFVIAAGHVRLTLGSDGYEADICTLGPGEFFGELSLLTGEPRTATARAVDDCVLLVIGRDVFATMMQDDLDLVFRMMNIIGRRLSEADLPLQKHALRLGQIRLVATCLRELVRCRQGLPHAFDIDALAGTIGAKAEAVRGTVDELARAGAGTVAGARWRFDSWEHVERLVDALAGYAGPEAD